MKDKKILTLALGIVAFLAAFYLVLFLKGSFEGETPVQKKSEEIVLDFSHWREYKSEVGDFSAEFPSIPVHSSEAVPLKGLETKGVNHAYLAQEPDGTGIMVRVMQYPPDYSFSDPEATLKEPFDLLLASAEGNVAREIRKTEYEGNQAFIFEIENPDVRMKGESILVGHTLYTLLYFTRVTLYEEGIWEKFFSSFSVEKN